MGNTPHNFIDIHVHLIPEVDDGPSTFQELLRMLQLAHEAGTRKMIATPHMFLDPYNNRDMCQMNNRFVQVISRIKQCSEVPEFAFLKEMAFYLGSENYASPEFLEALIDRCVLTLNDSRYLLIEFPLFLPPLKFEFLLGRVFDAGFIPVLAHPERYLAVQEDPDRVARFLEFGCISQINGDSILGAGGPSVRKACIALLDKGLVHVVASDGHRATSRTPHCDRAFLRLKQMYPPEKISCWMSRNPYLILNNNPVLGA